VTTAIDLHALLPGDLSSWEEHRWLEGAAWAVDELPRRGIDATPEALQAAGAAWLEAYHRGVSDGEGNAPPPMSRRGDE
jgi:hypothetical protein